LVLVITELPDGPQQPRFEGDPVEARKVGREGQSAELRGGGGGGRARVWESGGGIASQLVDQLRRNDAVHQGVTLGPPPLNFGIG
jgi:hypothetical protein